MKKKILLTLFFLLIFLGIYTAVQGFSCDYEGRTFDFGDINLPYEYVSVFFYSSNLNKQCNIYVSLKETIIKMISK